MSAFESGERKAIPAVLVYLKHRDGHGDRTLMIHRNSDSRPGDYHSGKWNGLGGKCEADESFVSAARREIHEEAGVDLPEEAFEALGFLHFPNFKAHKSEDWLVWIYTARVTDAQVAQISSSNAEGDLHWVATQDLEKLNLWAGDRHFIPWVRDERKFAGTIWYQGQEVLRHQLQSL